MPQEWSVMHHHVDRTVSDDEEAGLGLSIEGFEEPQLRGMFARAEDAHKAAAAPEMLGVLELVLTLVPGMDTLPENIYAAAHHAVAKARGHKPCQ